MENRTTSGAAIITGASRGLGLGIAQALASAGHPVVLTARGIDDLDRASASIEALGGEALAFPGDVTDQAHVERLVGIARDRFGKIDAVVNNAGALPVLEPLEALTWERWRRSIDVDVRGLFTTTRAVAPVLRAQRSGTIFTVAAAGGGTATSPLHMSLSPGQAALVALSRCVGEWLAPAGVTAHCLYPRITPAGGVGLAAAAAFGAEVGMSAHEWVHDRLGDDVLEPAQVGAAVVALLGERESGEWWVGPQGLTPRDAASSIRAA